MLDNFILKLKAIEKDVNIMNVRYADPKEEANKNLLYAFLIFLISIASVLGEIYHIEIVLVIAFFLFLIVFLLESQLWNFALCPEKKSIKSNVYVNRFMYVGLIVVLNITSVGVLKEKQWMIYRLFL
jgi:hypothetical protein